jgi:hypothetical protein
MQNLAENLELIIEKTKRLVNEYQLLKAENEKLEVQLSHLKVEADQYKKMAEQKIAIEEEEIVEVKKESEIKVDIADQNKAEVDEGKTPDNKQLKIKLDEFIEDLDQCIQIIQSGEHGK